MNYLKLKDQVTAARAAVVDFEKETFTASQGQLLELKKLDAVVKAASKIYHEQFEEVMPIGDFWRALEIEKVREVYFTYAEFLD